MRKYFKSLCLALGVLCAGSVVTSCDSDTIAQLFPLISSFFNSGDTYLFTGSGTSQSYTGSYLKGGSWTQLNESEYTYETMQAQLVCTETTANLTTQAFNEGEVAVSEITLSNLALGVSEDQTYNVLSLVDGSCGISGTMTVEGVEYEACGVNITTAAATASEMVLELLVYFQGPNDGEDWTKAVKLSFSGTAEASAQ